MRLLSVNFTMERKQVPMLKTMFLFLKVIVHLVMTKDARNPTVSS